MSTTVHDAGANVVYHRVDSDSGSGSGRRPPGPTPRTQALLLIEPVHAPLAAQELARPHPRTVLVVDDNAADRDLHCLVLRAMGLNAVAASTGWEGLVCARTILPDLVLTDVRMPELDGWGLVDLLSADPRTASIPVILITAEDREPGARARTAGAAGLLQKPVELSHFQAAMTLALRTAPGAADHDPRSPPP